MRTRLSVRRLATKLAVSVVAILIALVAAEAALRLVVGRKEHARELRSMLDRSRAATPDPGVHNVSLRGLIQSSTNDRIVYEMKPGLRAMFVGAPVAINRAGFREREVAVAKPPGTFRIVGLGDSMMFGWGVPVEMTYLRVLEALLQARGDPVRYETLNFGVPGYNAVMEVETFRAVARWYQPDLVLVGYVPNDDQIPNFMKRSALGWPSNVYVYSLLMHGIAAMRNRARELMPAQFDLVRGHGQLSAVGDVPEAYRDMVGREAVRRAHATLALMTRELGVPTLVVGPYRGDIDPGQIAELEAHSRFTFLETSDAYAAYERRHGVKVDPAKIILSPQDPHPNVLGHRILAEAIHEVLIARRLVPPAGAKGRP